MTQTAAERAEANCGREDGSTRQRNGVRHMSGDVLMVRRSSLDRRAEQAVGEWDASHSVVSEGRHATYAHVCSGWVDR
jgi:hypothetical protein